MTDRTQPLSARYKSGLRPAGPPDLAHDVKARDPRHTTPVDGSANAGRAQGNASRIKKGKALHSR